MIRDYDSYKLATPPGFPEPGDEGEYEGSPHYHEASGKFYHKGKLIEWVAGQENNLDEPFDWQPGEVEFEMEGYNELTASEILEIRMRIIDNEIKSKN